MLKTLLYKLHLVIRHTLQTNLNPIVLGARAKVVALIQAYVVGPSTLAVSTILTAVNLKVRIYVVQLSTFRGVVNAVVNVIGSLFALVGSYMFVDWLIELNYSTVVERSICDDMSLTLLNSTQYSDLDGQFALVGLVSVVASVVLA